MKVSFEGYMKYLGAFKLSEFLDLVRVTHINPLPTPLHMAVFILKVTKNRRAIRTDYPRSF